MLCVRVLRVGVGVYESAWVCFSMSNIEGGGGGGVGAPPAATCSSALSYKSSLDVSGITDTLDSSD